MPEHGPGTTGRGADPAARLLRFLRDLARARRDPADGGGGERVHWLAELPGEVYVETDAGLGDVLFSVPVIPLRPPTVAEEFDGWLALRHWYRLLRELADGGGVADLATGLLSWRPAEGPAVSGHLLATPIRIVVEERTGRVDVLLDGSTALRDRELLAGLPGFRPARTDWVWDAVQAGQGFGLRPSVSDVLRKWSSVAFGDEPVAFREDWAAPSGAPSAAPRLRVAPALIVRPAGRAAVADHYDRLAARLPDLPGAAARFLEPGGRPPLLHVPERTPQDLADLLTGLLARGLRVLVATDADDVRAALHPRVAALCDPQGFTPDDPEPVEDLARLEAEAARTAADLRERLRRAENADEYDLGPGYRGDRAELARRVYAEAPDFNWLPPRPGLPTSPPLTREEVTELLRIRAEPGPDRTRHRDVDPCTLPSAPYVRTLIEAEQVAAERAGRNETDMSRRLRRCDVAVLARLDTAAATVDGALRDLGLAGHPSGWDAADHAVRAFTDALAHRRPAVWARVAEMAEQAEWAGRALETNVGHRVELPPGDLHLRRMASVAQDLRTYLVEGGALKRGPLRSTAQRQAEPLLTSVTVDGGPPTTPELLEVVFTHLMVLMACQELQYVWEAAGVSFPADVPLADRVARFRRAHGRLARVRDVLTAIEETVELLAGLSIPVTHPLQWYGYTTALETALLSQGVNRAAADLTALRDSIGSAADDPPELRRALDAIDARDADAYGDALIDLAEARQERAAQLRCADFEERLRAVHPDLLDALAVPSDAWLGRLGRWDEAWAWAHASARLEELPRSPAETQLRAGVEEAEARHRELAALRAWNAHCGASEAPGWLVPLWEIPEAVPDGGFDVVVVDGDQGPGAEALYVLWAAPRVILVGEPAAEVSGAAPQMRVLAEDLPDDLRVLVTSETSLFRVLLDRFEPPEEAPAGAGAGAGAGAREERVAEPWEFREGPSPLASERREAPLRPTKKPDVATAVPSPEPQLAPAPYQIPEPRQAPDMRPEPEPGPPPEPRRSPETRPLEGTEPSGRVPRGQVYAQAGRSIVTYKRPELVALVARIADGTPELDDDQVIELARRLLACPADEEMLVGARLRFAVQAYRTGGLDEE
ncbi:hypothetical protein [Actinomadura hibisca]|uniref:hypothetical protein n=1 Tax=Actinomadura hibisca TaxID=68565 RepID=UPI000830C21C|nr:hypothetical protein [Actinomadura hibisca]